MGDAYETRVGSLRRLIKTYDSDFTKLDAGIADPSRTNRICAECGRDDQKGETQKEA